MYSPDKIVVGIEPPDARPWDAANLTAASRLAMRRAFQLANALNSELCLVTVLEPSINLFSDAADQNKQTTEAAALLADLEQQYCRKTKTPPNVSTIVASGRPWLEILKAAGPSPNNLIVCGTRNNNRINQFLFGSTGQKLLRNAICPVLLNHPRLDDNETFDILAATDLTEVGEEVLLTAVGIAQALPARLHVRHAIDTPNNPDVSDTEQSEQKLAQRRTDIRLRCEELLHDQLEMTDYRSLELGTQVEVMDGSATTCLLSTIKDCDIDLLIMATSAIGGLAGAVFGNTAERLLPDLSCSLLAIKPDDFQCPIDIPAAEYST